jgi:hypothetical protein
MVRWYNGRVFQRPQTPISSDLSKTGLDKPRSRDGRSLAATLPTFIFLHLRVIAFLSLK